MPLHRPLMTACRRRRLPLALGLATLLGLSACGKTAQDPQAGQAAPPRGVGDIVSQALSEARSPWTLKDGVDKMTQIRLVSAEMQHQPEDEPMLIVNAKVVCDPGLEDGQFYFEFSTHSSKPKDNGILPSVRIKFAEHRRDMKQLMQFQLLTQGLVPGNLPIQDMTEVAVRIDERKPDTALYPDVPAVSYQYNNQIRVFPFHLEKQLGRRVSTLRVAIATEQGLPNVLVDYADKNVAAVVKACEAHRPTLAAMPAAPQPAPAAPSVPAPSTSASVPKSEQQWPAVGTLTVPASSYETPPPANAPAPAQPEGNRP